MTQAHRRYLLIEMAISAAINAALSIAFVLLLFGGLARVSTPALVRDALPQSFMIALMASLVPTSLTRKRLRAGTIAPLPGGGRSGSALVLSLLTALVVAAIAGALHWALLPLLLPGGAPFGAMLVAKAVYGAVLGAFVTLFALRRALVG